MTEEHPFRPLYNEVEPVQVIYKLTMNELVEAVSEWLQKHKGAQVGSNLVPWVVTSQGNYGREKDATAFQLEDREA